MGQGIDERAGDRQGPDQPSAIHDRRIKPRGVLPRHVQMWLMVAMAVVILAIILFTGHPEPRPRSSSGAPAPQPSLVPPERVKSYEQGLAAEAARQQQAVTQPASAGRAGTPANLGPATVIDPLSEERRRREYQSLFADSVALSRRAGDRQPFAEPRPQGRDAAPSTAPASPELAMLQQLLSQRPTPSSPRAAPAPSPPAVVPPVADSPSVSGVAPDVADASPRETGPIHSGGPLHRLVEGTVIETVLLNRLDGTFAGPVTCLVTTPVYAHDRQSVVIPAGGRLLGSASPVQTWGDSRLAVSFHRLVMPDARTYSLDRFKGLGQVGDTGLKDSVNRHYLQVFGASLAIGALSGLAQYGSRHTVDASVGDAYRQATGSSLAASTGRVLDRYLNVLPTITIREGYRIKVYLTNDLQLPPYSAAPAGGVR